jgi:hypothetical protein
LISERPQSNRPWRQDSDPDAAYREDFVRLLARLGLQPDLAIALVEAGTGHPFATCSPAQLVPLLEELLELLRAHRSPMDARQPCRA